MSKEALYKIIKGPDTKDFERWYLNQYTDSNILYLLASHPVFKFIPIKKTGVATSFFSNLHNDRSTIEIEGEFFWEFKPFDFIRIEFFGEYNTENQKGEIFFKLDGFTEIKEESVIYKNLFIAVKT